MSSFVKCPWGRIGRIDSFLTRLTPIGFFVLHRDNPFHNFEHASHVTMSVVKLLSRIVAPNLTANDIDTNSNIASTLHDHTYGITSDPLTQFAVVLSALIHDGMYPNEQCHIRSKSSSSSGLAYKRFPDSFAFPAVDHLGVPNAQLCKENAFIARAYKGKSVAEQNSVDVGTCTRRECEHRR
jgi:hypothetical protein